MLLEENKPLAPFTTFGIGGPARWFIAARNPAEVAEAARWARDRDLPVFVLGGGSNLLVADSGFPGLVLHIALRGIQEQHIASDSVLFRVAAGENWDTFVQRVVEVNCAGVECLAGIPGTVGGTPVQNVGAYGQEVASVIERVCAYDLVSGEDVEFTAEECGFAYRRSRFNSSDRGHYVVTSVDFRLLRGGSPNLSYGELQRAFPAGARPALTDVVAEVRRIRQGKGMLLVENDPDCRSAGSFFKNPIVPPEALARISEAAEKEPPQFPAGQKGLVKIPAAWLIEQAGFRKGYKEGPVGLSSRHTLALINRGDATAADVLALAHRIRDEVAVRFEIQLEMEPVPVGF